MSQQQHEAEIREMRERLDRIERKQNERKYDPPFGARVWLFLALVIGIPAVIVIVGAVADTV
jgi:hypothetical protein